MRAPDVQGASAHAYACSAAVVFFGRVFERLWSLSILEPLTWGGDRREVVLRGGWRAFVRLVHGLGARVRLGHVGAEMMWSRRRNVLGVVGGGGRVRLVRVGRGGTARLGRVGGRSGSQVGRGRGRGGDERGRG